jgi:EAL domain-containing protein (putative c-di-GMP-specific phosphodiesterase class I)/DNA-binding NarL/FixJ family response regulator
VPAAQRSAESVAAPTANPLMLFVGDGPVDHRLIRALLAGARGPFDVEIATLPEAARWPGERRPACLLLDLSGPREQALAAVRALSSQHPSVPCIGLTDADEDGLAVDAIRAGAQDCLDKRRLTPHTLAHAIRHAIARTRGADAHQDPVAANADGTAEPFPRWRRRSRSLAEISTERHSVPGWSQVIAEALARDRFELWEQPILELASGTVKRSELLLRMRSPHTGVVLPGAFLAFAERDGQIQEIDRWVVTHALALLAQRQSAGIDLDLQVNLSAKSVGDPEMISFIADQVASAPIDPTRLTFEITETAVTTDLSLTCALAEKLIGLGCEIALDDFGAGVGSFSYLKRLPCHGIKIDGDFVKELPGHRADQLIVEAIVAIAQGLGKHTTAEFVADERCLAFVAELGVDHAQGHHISCPVPARIRPDEAWLAPNFRQPKPSPRLSAHRGWRGLPEPSSHAAVVAGLA